MDAADVAQVVESLRQALTATPDDPAEVLSGFGWTDLLDDEPQVAVAALFPLRGKLLTPGSALDPVLLAVVGAVGRQCDRVVLPSLGFHCASGHYDGQGAVHYDGVAQMGTGSLLVPCVTPDGATIFAVTGDVSVVEGNPLDPTAAWVRVR